MKIETDHDDRKNIPIFSGFLMYFPAAIVEVAKVSKACNDQHNPGEPMHWSRDKSNDHLDAGSRHLMDAGPDGNNRDKDGQLHLAKAMWRIAAKLQLVCEERTVREAASPVLHRHADAMGSFKEYIDEAAARNKGAGLYPGS